MDRAQFYVNLRGIAVLAEIPPEHCRRSQHGRHRLFVLVGLSGWVNCRQQEMIKLQNPQIQALMDKMGRKRIRERLSHRSRF